jgi:hypothetical protein
MSRITLTVAAALTTLALAAPAAVAQPTRDSGATRTSSLAGSSAPSQDLRNPDNRAIQPALAQERYHSSYGGKTGDPAQDLRSPDARDAALGRGTFSVPDIAVIKVPQPAPVADDDIDWGDVGIGAGGALGLALLALGATFAILHRRQGTRPVATTS